MKNYFRKVAFGISPNEEVPSDPLNWALNQLDDIPKLSWTGKIHSSQMPSRQDKVPHHLHPHCD